MTRVLVVEDEESYADALSYMLRKEGYDVSLAATGPDALTEFDRNGADIVLLDLMLPGLPGTEVCRQIRAVSNVPVIMVSAKDDEVDKIVGLELGADDYVTKPYSPRELVARIRAVLRRGNGEGIPPQFQERIFERFFQVPGVEAGRRGSRALHLPGGRAGARRGDGRGRARSAREAPSGSRSRPLRERTLEPSAPPLLALPPQRRRVDARGCAPPRPCVGGAGQDAERRARARPPRP